MRKIIGITLILLISVLVIFSACSVSNDNNQLEIENDSSQTDNISELDSAMDENSVKSENSESGTDLQDGTSAEYPNHPRIEPPEGYIDGELYVAEIEIWSTPTTLSFNIPKGLTVTSTEFITKGDGVITLSDDSGNIICYILIVSSTGELPEKVGIPIEAKRYDDGFWWIKDKVFQKSFRGEKIVYDIEIMDTSIFIISLPEEEIFDLMIAGSIVIDIHEGEKRDSPC